MKKNKKILTIFGIIISSEILFILIIVLFLMLLGNNNKSRTIMIYMVGSNLESKGGIATSDLNSIKKNIDPNENVNVIVIAGGSTKWNNNYIDSNETSIYELNNGNFVKVKQQQIENMGLSNTLSDFLNYTYNNYVTDEYDLIFWNHGGAIDGSEYDELNMDDNLSLEEMNNALKNSPFNDKKLELVIFRTCLNGTIEIGSILSRYANYLVASEEETLGASYTSVLNFIGNISSKDSGIEIGKKYIDAYGKQIDDIKSISYSGKDDSIYSTYSLIDLNGISSLVNSLNDFFDDIDVTSNYDIISKVRANLYQYANDVPAYDMVDLYNLVYNLKNLSPKKANDVLNKIDNIVIYNYATDDNSRGISIYFPYNGNDRIKNKFISIYNGLGDFSNYGEFITKFYNIQSSDYNRFSYNSNKIESSVSAEDNTYADFELELTDEQVKTFARADYYVFRDLHTGYYKAVYNGIDAKLDGNILKASIKDRQLQVFDGGGNKADLIAYEKENNKNYIKYTTNVLLQTFTGDISTWKNDQAIMTLYYDKKTNKTSIANVVYDSKDDKTNSISVNIYDYDNISFSLTSGWKILDNNGNYTGPVIENGSVVGDGIITGFESKPKDLKFELSKFDSNEDYYCVFVIYDTHNNKSFSKLIKLK